MNRQNPTTSYKLYAGTYTTVLDHVHGKADGIYIFDFDSMTGKLTPSGICAGVVNPSYLVINKNGQYLYSVNEIKQFEGMSSGAISAFSIDPISGNLELLNTKPSLGADPCYLSLDHQGCYLFVANYWDGNLAAYPLTQDGSLCSNSEFIQHHGSSINPIRQTSAHVHSTVIDPTNHFLYCADLGIDKIMIYAFDQHTGKLTPNMIPYQVVTPGSGPRHIVFHPNGRWMYLINELSSTITIYHIHTQDGSLIEIQTVQTLPSGYDGVNLCADIHIHPSGKYLYGSNRGHNSLVCYEIDDSGKLHYISHQSTYGLIPRNFTIDPTGNWILVANQDSDNIVTLAINHTGSLQPTGIVTETPSPVCLKFL